MTAGAPVPRWLRIAAAAGIAVAALVALNPSTAAPTAVAQTPSDGARLELLDQDFSFQPDGTIHLEYRLTGLVGDPLELVPPPPVVTTTTTTPVEVDPAAPTTTAAPPPPPPEPLQLTVLVTNYEPIAAVSDVSRVVGSDVDRAVFDDVSDAVDGVAIDLRPLATLEDDGTVTFTLEVPTDVAAVSGPDSLKFERAGLSPLRVQVVVGDPADDLVVATAGTIVERLRAPDEPPPPPPIDLSVVVATPQPGPAAAPNVAVAAAADLRDAVDLAGTLDAPVTLQVPPDLVAATASTPEASTQLATALAGDELVATPLVPLDVSSAVAAGRAESFTRLVVAGADVLTEAVPSAPARRDVWITTEALSAAGAQHLLDLGARFVIVPQSVYRDTISRNLPATDLFVNAALPDGGRLPLLVVDDLSEDLQPSVTDEILADSTPTEWAVRATAVMLVAQQLDNEAATTGTLSGPSPERSRILSTPDLLAPDARLLGALERLVSTTPSLRFSAASALTGVTDVQRDSDGPVVVDLPAVAGPSLDDRIALIEATALTMTSVSSMLPADDPRPTEWAVELDSLISTGYTDAEVVAATSALGAEADALRDAVVLPEPFTFTLTGRSGTIEVRLGNTSDERLTVVVHLESSKVGFPSGDQTVELRPLDETSVIVPVDAQSNGTSSIELTVFTPAGEQLAQPVTLTARVTALTGLGQVLTGGFLLVLLTWWLSHWRGRRRAAHATNAGEDAGDPGDDAGDQTGDRDDLEHDDHRGPLDADDVPNPDVVEHRSAGQDVESDTL